MAKCVPVLCTFIIQVKLRAYIFYNSINNELSHGHSWYSFALGFLINKYFIVKYNQYGIDTSAVQ